MNKFFARDVLGFSILELMIVIAIAGVISAVAIPRMQNMIRNNQVSAQNNELIALIHLTRNEGIRRNPLLGQSVRLELAADGATWEGNVFPPGELETVGDCPVGAIRCANHERVRLRAANEDDFVLLFDNRGYLVDAAGTLRVDGVTLFLVHQDCGNELQSRQIRILPTGQVNSERADCNPL